MRTPGGYFLIQMRFSKPARTYSEQAEILISRGLIANTKQELIQYLSSLNYYRLRAYLIPFEVDPQTHQLRDNTHFSTVLDLYLFDRALRLLLMDAIERFEVALRTRLSYHLSHTHDPHAHLKDHLFKKNNFRNNLNRLKKEVERSREPFIEYFQKTYLEELPPIWAVCEVMSFGSLSRWYSDLIRREDRQAIAKEFDIDERILVSFTHHLVTVRNICAHHGRIWNRQFTFTFKLPKKGAAAELPYNTQQERKLYNTLVLLGYFLDKLSSASPAHYQNHGVNGRGWRLHLLDIIQSCPVSLCAMGATPQSWDHRFWR